jgi:hypothetical protein
MALVNAALHLYFQAGLRANEAFSCTAKALKKSLVRGKAAKKAGLRRHMYVTCSLQTKEERYETTTVPVAFDTWGECPLSTGKWVVRGLRALKKAGRGPKTHPKRPFFASKNGVSWKMAWFWKKHVKTRLIRLREQKRGGLKRNADVSRFGSNSPRRTWRSMAAKRPHPVCDDLCERQARWRTKQRKRQRLSLSMAQLYNDPDVEELLRATYYLTPLK